MLVPAVVRAEIYACTVTGELLLTQKIVKLDRLFTVRCSSGGSGNFREAVVACACFPFFAAESIDQLSFLFSLWERRLARSSLRVKKVLQVLVGLKDTPLSAPTAAKMPITNGDAAANGTAHLMAESHVEDYKTAEEFLSKNYKEKDGISIHSLIDSAKNGGLTYNDFLVLPGHIGIAFNLPASPRSGLILCRFPRR